MSKGCGLCAKICNVRALDLTPRVKGESRKLLIDHDLCLGCGACISVCKTSSIHLTPMLRPETPLKKKDLFVKILKEKKRFAPYVISGIKTKLLRSVGIK